MTEKIITVKSLADIPPADKGYVDLKREGKTLRIPVRGLPLAVQQEIEATYQVPSPPVQYKRVKGQDKPQPVEAFDDANWQKEAAKVRERAFHATILAGIDLEIDGASLDEKWDNFKKAGFVAGDLLALSDGIMRLSNMDEAMVGAARDFSKSNGRGSGQ